MYAVCLLCVSRSVCDPKSDNAIFQYISNKMQLYTVYLYLETALHVLGGTSTHHQERIQLSTASGIFHTVTATCRYSGS